MLPRYVGKGIWETVIVSVAGWQGSQEEGEGRGDIAEKRKAKAIWSQKGCHMCQMTFACGNDNDFSLPRRDNNEMQTKKGRGTAAHDVARGRERGGKTREWNFIESRDICICLPYLWIWNCQDELQISFARPRKWLSCHTCVCVGVSICLSVCVLAS